MHIFKGKSVTILKHLIRAIYCRQAETHSSICLDSALKRVRMLILRNYKKMCGGIILQNDIILFTKTCLYKCKWFLNSKKVILNTGLVKMAIFLILFEIKSFFYPAWTFIFSKIVQVDCKVKLLKSRA